MTLSFSQTINKKPTYFVEKIIKGIQFISPPLADLAIKAGYQFNMDVYLKCSPKIHTAREDTNNRWGANRIIQFVINNRTAKRFQFVNYDLPCISTQKMIVHYWFNTKTQLFDAPTVMIDGKELTKKQIDELAINDGFESRAEFFQYFNRDWSGKLIHWTNKKY